MLYRGLGFRVYGLNFLKGGHMCYSGPRLHSETGFPANLPSVRLGHQGKHQAFEEKKVPQCFRPQCSLAITSTHSSSLLYLGYCPPPPPPAVTYRALNSDPNIACYWGGQYPSYGPVWARPHGVRHTGADCCGDRVFGLSPGLFPGAVRHKTR